MMNGRRFGIALCFVMLVSLPWAVLVEAQEQGSWSPPYRLSSEKGGASEASMVSDHYGYVHVFWIEKSLLDKQSSIQYARFDGEAWAGPIDIYVADPGNQIEYVSSTVDQNSQLHIIWTEGVSGPMYYSNAPSHDALSAQNWTSPLRIRIPAFRFKLQIDAEDVFHIVYTDFYGEQPGVYHIRSENQGRAWSEPTWLDPDILPNHSPFWPQFELDDGGGLHTVWDYVDPESGLGRWVRYAHSLDGGKTWSIPFTIDEADESDDELRMSNPGLATHGKNVYIVWAGDAQTHREFRFSTDSGQTWSVPVRILGDLLGQALGDSLAVDAAGRVHFAGQIRYPQGLYHAYWDRDYWSVPSLAYLIARDAHDDMAGRIHAHNVRLAIRSGNQLVITFTNSPSESEPLVLYAIHRTLDDVSPSATLLTPTPTATRTSVPASVAVAVTTTPVGTKRTEPVLTDSPIEEGNHPGYPVVVSILPALGLILTISAVKRLLRNQLR